ncbi:MAG: two-component system, NarL family, nitrate/nitrite response regulator NarL [Acidobacteriota bacterium]|jgi:DNA-binding NarL/FixJ family response regulator|nr:two-component system, NarL family, nitrate/nitrite response regulator NarL [Acidobacteriota bacterium]
MLPQQLTPLPFSTGFVPSHAPDSIRVALTGTDPLARAGLSSILGAFEDLDVAGDLELDARTASRLGLLSADVVICDIGTTAGAITALPKVEQPLLVLIADRSLAAAAMNAGARGVLLRTTAPARIHSALRAIADGMVVVDDELAERVLLHPRASVEMIEPLTNREQEVMQLLAAGRTNKEIAQNLGISDHTVKFHVNGILGKLGVESRTEAVVHAARLGIVML